MPTCCGSRWTGLSVSSRPITPRQFHDAAGVEDWRVVGDGAYAHFRTGSFAAGVALVDAIGRLADAANHHPDVDLRYRGVTVRLVSHDVEGLSERDVELARQISAAARELDVPRRPGRRPGGPGHHRRPRRLRGDAVLAGRARLPGGGRRGPGRPPRPRAVAVVPGHG